MTKFTLRDFASPLFCAPSSINIGLFIQGEGTKTISLPPFLYYAFKAKLLTNWHLTDESQSRDNLDKLAENQIRIIARALFRTIQLENIHVEKHKSTIIQAKILDYILNDQTSEDDLFTDLKSISINATRSKKNFTVPNYLFKKLKQILGDQNSVKLLIHQTSFDIRTTLNENKAPEPGSWSRSVHNKLFEKLILLGDEDTINLLDVNLIAKKNHACFKTTNNQ